MKTTDEGQNQFVHQRGDIRHRDYESWTASHWDWAWLECPFWISPSDIDFVIERKGWFLLAECKPTGADLQRGQFLTLKALAAKPHVFVYVLWGDQSPESYARIAADGSGWTKHTAFDGGTRYKAIEQTPTSRDDWQRIVKGFFDAVDRKAA